MTDQSTPESPGGCPATGTEPAPGGDPLCNSQITDSVTQSSVHALGLGPAVAAVNAYLGQAQAQNILFANMVGQQAQYATIAATALTDQLTQMFARGDSQ